MGNKDGFAKNLQRIREGYDDMRLEWKQNNASVKSAWVRKDMPGLTHHLSDYRGACQEHMWKFWFYAFWPRRVVEVIILTVVYYA
tara:strand:- start:18274 stop:18528 length:255 start_codon:yes stop_codon:yes gene_type:complete